MSYNFEGIVALSNCSGSLIKFEGQADNTPAFPNAEVMVPAAEWKYFMDDGEMGGMTMDGMMTDAQMTDLEGASGAAFDTMFLEMMIDHHGGAIGMAKMEIADGSNPDAIALAEAIASAQEAEIETMQALLDEK